MPRSIGLLNAPLTFHPRDARVPGARPLNAGHPGFPTSCSSPQMWLVVPAALRSPLEPVASLAHDSA